MAVRVEYSTGPIHHYSTGTKWYIDAERQLHVMDSQGIHLAAASTNQWISVTMDGATEIIRAE